MGSLDITKFESPRKKIIRLLLLLIGEFVYNIMPFVLKNALVVFSRIVIAKFHDFIHNFIEIYLDNWIVYNLIKEHIRILRLILDHYRQLHISLNMRKCIFCIPFGNLLGHIVCREGVFVDPLKIAVILNMPPPTSFKQLKTTLGHTGH